MPSISKNISTGCRDSSGILRIKIFPVRITNACNATSCLDTTDFLDLFFVSSSVEVGELVDRNIPFLAYFLTIFAVEMLSSKLRLSSCSAWAWHKRWNGQSGQCLFRMMGGTAQARSLLSTLARAQGAAWGLWNSCPVWRYALYRPSQWFFLLRRLVLHVCQHIPDKDQLTFLVLAYAVCAPPRSWVRNRGLPPGNCPSTLVRRPHSASSPSTWRRALISTSLPLRRSPTSRVA